MGVFYARQSTSNLIRDAYLERKKGETQPFIKKLTNEHM